MKRMWRVLPGLFLAVSLGVTGCAGDRGVDPDDLPDLTLTEAREIQNSQLQEFIDLVPTDQVTEVWGPIPDAYGMSCDTDLGGRVPYGKERTGSYSLPGGAEVYVQETTDVLGWFDEITARQEALGWEVKKNTDYRTELVLHSPDGFRYSLAHLPQGDYERSSIRLGSSSPCFIPSDDFNVHKAY